MNFSNLFDAVTGEASSTRGWIALALAVALAAGTVCLLGWAVLRGVRGLARGNAGGRRVLIVVAVTVAFAVAGIGGVQSFQAVSDKFDSALVPLVADGMVVACTALRLAALTRGWRIPGALLTTYVFIGGTVVLNVDAANGQLDKAIAHALAPLAYAVLVEMLAHMLRLHLKLSQPVRAKLSALTWFTSPVITTRVWLHLSRTGTTDPIEARALVQQVVRMSSRLSTVCPSWRLWPLDSARAARSAALQTIRDGLLTAGALAALLPTGRRLSAGELLAVVDGAALGIPTAEPEPAPRADFPAWAVLWLLAASGDRIDPPADQLADEDSSDDAEESVELAWAIGFVFGALQQQTQLHQAALLPPSAGAATAVQPVSAGAVQPPAPAHYAPTAPVHRPEVHRATGAPVQSRTAAAPAAAASRSASVISAPVSESARSGAGVGPKDDDEAAVAELVEASRRVHGGQPLGQREITRLLGCGFPRAKRLQALAGWASPRVGGDADHDGVNDTDESDADSNEDDDEIPSNETDELEMSSNR
ncbi:hypothetical protein HPO96_29325 [Kribbella sandramycini]|uniref:DUF2637 domain-containing protein n=1 Tax=Kribbella sandramycini TaxID=60450 RepID=A0A7Y4P1K1_9ACTN|nr:hypothetical protein [Kribbella sandramycini]MBB6571713.1 hypothetical protein [Kribbella sandramycini]NOL44357.1 hypothetical protein [Kribbella sandramycini]